jgi:GGDEF domain-containing protein
VTRTQADTWSERSVDAESTDLLTGLATAAGLRSALEACAASPSGLDGRGLVLVDVDGFHRFDLRATFHRR